MTKKHVQKNIIIATLVLIAGVFITAGCSSVSNVTPTVAMPTVQPSITPIPPTPTPLPKNLTVCLGQEPSGLFIYDGSYTQSKWSILEAIYDGPVDYVNYEYRPVILEKLPSLADGDAALVPVEMKDGMDMVDADGNLMTLQKGVKILPSGCTSSECIIEYDGKTPVKMDQMVVKFKIKSGLTWSDGTAITSQDSVTSYSLAASPLIPTNKGIIQRTASYKATDELSVEWTGLPGFMDQKFATRFWLPLPGHILSGKDPATLISDPGITEKPLGWGPFVISEWVRGDHITLTKNAAYFRAAEGLPKVDILTFRFLGINPEQSLQALINGECDVLDQSTLLDDQLTSMLELKKAGKLNAVIAAAPFSDQLVINIKPASYDDGYNVAKGDRPDIFGDANVRRAIAMCINREAINTELLGGQSTIPNGYLPAGDPMVDNEVQGIPYDPAAGAALLEQSGWRDQDQDPSTPRVAFTVKNVFAGAKLEVNYATTNAGLRKKSSEMIAADLQKCGFKVNLTYLTPEQLFAPGPDGLLFGRKFDLAQFQWDIGNASYCTLYESSQVPSAANFWIGSNVTGYSSKDFDTTCQDSRIALTGQTGYEDAQQAPQVIFNTDIPVIPLYQNVQVGAARMDMCGFQLDPTSRSDLWNIETLDYGTTCQ